MSSGRRADHWRADALLSMQEHTVAPVLYASQWFLTLFSCPFPAAFSCRIIDTVLAEGHSEILQQVRCSIRASAAPAAVARWHRGIVLSTLNFKLPPAPLRTPHLWRRSVGQLL